jgi:hypothetical protein
MTFAIGESPVGESHIGELPATQRFHFINIKNSLYFRILTVQDESRVGFLNL